MEAEINQPYIRTEGFKFWVNVLHRPTVLLNDTARL